MKKCLQLCGPKHAGQNFKNLISSKVFRFLFKLQILTLYQLICPSTRISISNGFSLIWNVVNKVLISYRTPMKSILPTHSDGLSSMQRLIQFGTSLCCPTVTSSWPIRMKKPEILFWNKARSFWKNTFEYDWVKQSVKFRKMQYLTVILWIVYQIERGDPFITEDFGHWSFEGGLVDLRASRVLARRRRNLQRHQFRAATVFIEPGSENHTDLDDYQFVNISNLRSFIDECSWIVSFFLAIMKLTPFRNYPSWSQNIG